MVVSYVVSEGKIVWDVQSKETGEYLGKMAIIIDSDERGVHSEVATTEMLTESLRAMNMTERQISLSVLEMVMDGLTGLVETMKEHGESGLHGSDGNPLPRPN